MTIRRVHSDVPHIRAFTLVELLIVITIIAILIAIVVASSKGIAQRGQERATRNVLQALDRAMEEYKIATGAFPIYNAEAYEFVPGLDNELTTFPKSAGGDGERHPARPDAALFVAQAGGFGEVDAILQGIPSKFMRITAAPTGDDVQRDVTPSFVDSWAQPGWPAGDDVNKPFPIRDQQVIYYIQPQNVLAQALYGTCANGRPYFMSAGADRGYGLGADSAQYGSETSEEYQARIEGLLKDNIYSYEDVGTPNREANFFTDIRSKSGI